MTDLDDLALVEARRVRRVARVVDTSGVAAGRVRGDSNASSLGGARFCVRLPAASPTH